MTVAMTQPIKTYTADFRGCNSRTGFLLILARAFSVGALNILGGGLWSGICQRILLLAVSDSRVNVKILGLDDVYGNLPRDCERLINLLKKAKSKNGVFNTEVIIGKRGWEI